MRSSASTSGGELRYAPALYPVSLDVQKFPAEEPVQTAVPQVLETLVTYADGEAQPLLAESWENPDPMTWTFTLREGVMFSDGTPLTANDVKASLERLIALEGPLTPLFAAVTEIRADDDATFTVNTSEPLGTMLSSLSLVFIGQASGVESDGYWLNPIGTGPFVVDEYVADDNIELVRNEEYWGEPALLDRLTIVNMPEVGGADHRAADRRGRRAHADPAGPGRRRSRDRTASVSRRRQLQVLLHLVQPGPQAVRRHAGPAGDVARAGPRGPRQGPVRRRGTVALAPITQAVFGAPELEPYAYDPALAKQLLTEAGFPDGFRPRCSGRWRVVRTSGRWRRR